MGSVSTVISAVTYPLGTDADEATGFLKYTVLNNVISGSGMSLAESISTGLLTGRGLQLRNAFNYARDYYSWGIPYSGLWFTPSPDRAPLTAILQALNPGCDIEYHGLNVGSPMASYWAYRTLAENYGYDAEYGEWASPPAGVDKHALVDYDMTVIQPPTDVYGMPMWVGYWDMAAAMSIIVTNPDNTTQILGVRYYPVDSNWDRDPNTIPADLLYTSYDYIQAQYRTIKTYPTTTTRTTRAFATGDFSHVSVSTVQVVNAGETQETTTITTMTVSGSTTTIVTELTNKLTSRLKYYLYRTNATSASPGYQATLSNWSQALPYSSPFFPSIPLRVNNVDWTDTAHRSTDLYKTSKQLLKRFGLDMQQIADQVNTNPNIKDIDYAYITFGVPINAKAPECKQYLYAFFTRMRGFDPADVTDPPVNPDTGDYYHPDMAALHVWYTQHANETFNCKFRWRYIKTTVETGVVATGAAVGDIAIVNGAHATRVFRYANGHIEITEDDSIIYLRKQLDANSYEQMEIRGLVMNNLVYGAKWNIVPAWDQINDPDNVNGCIIPLEYDVLFSLPLPVVTDLAYHVPQIVFNCYTVVKKKWYQTNFFKYLMIVVAIVITVMTWGADGGSSLGYALAYSMVAATGVTGVLLTFLAHVLFSLAMLIISQIIAKISVALFGDKWGAVIGAIVMIAVGSYANTGSWTAGFGIQAGQITAQSIIQATSAIFKVGQAYMTGEMHDLQDQMQALQSEEKLRMAQLEQLNKELASYNHADMIDIQGLIDSTRVMFEDVGSFLDRTLMTGSDVAEMTNGLITNFAQLGVQLPTT